MRSADGNEDLILPAGFVGVYFDANPYLDRGFVLGYNNLMCAHVTIVTWDELLAVARAMRSFTPISDLPDWPARQPHYVDAFPKALVPVLLSAASMKDFGEEVVQWMSEVPVSPTSSAEKLARVSSGQTGEYAAELLAQPAQLTWGYTLEGKRDVIFNTRIETAAQSPLWRNSFENRHCIVPVHSFFEPHKTERVRRSNGKELKQVYRFEEPDQPVMLLAGIWDKDRFSILTTEPNAYVSPIHPRMPVVLDQSGALQWLSFQGLNSNQNIPLVSQPLYLATSLSSEQASSEQSTSSSGQQLSLF